MNECMQTGKPLISILMAVYEPNMEWLKEQLDSLEAQTYPNLKLYICDDCSTEVPFSEIKRCVSDSIHAFPYQIERNEENLGSNGTFERLTKEAEGEYFAYCDQDDIWLPEKLSILQEEIRRRGALLACSDMEVIDAHRIRIAGSITKVRKHHRFLDGEGLAPLLLVTNFVTGCTMVVESSCAKAAVPFCPFMVHDHYLALFAASRGAIASFRGATILYRIHTGNQTAVLTGVTDKDSYYRIRIQSTVRRFRWLEQAWVWAEEPLRTEIMNALEWAEAREAYGSGNRKVWKKLWKLRRFSRMATCFELFLPFLPQPVFRLAIQLKRRNMI